MQLSMYLFACGALLALSLQSVAEGASIPMYEDGNEDNNQVDNSLDANAERFEPVHPSWIKITKELPPVVRRASGARIELECEADGGPAPVITWLRDNVPITEGDDYENNALIEGTEPGLARATSRLIVNNFLPVDKITYTCLARSGTKSAFTTTTVHTTHNVLPKTTNLSEYLLLNQEVLAAPSKPRIVSFYQTVVETSGNTLVLPCKIVGNPRPEFYWLDSENDVITNQDPRIKIMSSGELIIQGLRWSDMGRYTCVARNALGKDSIGTFVYPTINN